MTKSEQKTDVVKQKENEHTNEDSTPEEKRTGKFDLEEFLKNNYELFAVLSVFGAISVYLPKMGSINSNIFLRVGFVSTLFLILMTEFIIDRRFFLEIGRTFGLVKAFLHPSSDTYEMVLFFIPFNALAVSLVAISGSYRATLAFLFQFVGVSFGVVITFHIIKVLNGGENEGDDDQNLIAYIIASIFVGLILLAIGGKGMEIVEKVGKAQQETLFAFTPQLGVLSVLDSLFFGIGLAGLIYWLIAAVLLVYVFVQILNKIYDFGQLLVNRLV